MEYPIAFTLLNDFIFCPASIYYHGLDSDTEQLLYQTDFQLNGSHAHRAIDESHYSNRLNIMQGTEVYCSKYGLYGKIDVFDCTKGILTERKRKITTVDDGYVFQVYAQYFALMEQGYKVKELRLYSSSDNKVFPIVSPDVDHEFRSKFEDTIHGIRGFSLDLFQQDNPLKCKQCIYEELCLFSCLKRG